MQVLLADIATLIALERGGLVETLARLEYEFAITDVQFDTHVRGQVGEGLLQNGIHLIELDDTDMMNALALTKRWRSISLPEACALAYANAHAVTLLCSDPHLSRLAQEAGLTCRDLLWLVDELHQQGSIPSNVLRDSLHEIASHPRCGLSKKEVQRRLQLLEQEEPVDDELEAP